MAAATTRRSMWMRSKVELARWRLTAVAWQIVVKGYVDRVLSMTYIPALSGVG